VLTLRKNIAFTLIGNVIYNISQWGWLMLLAKFLDKESIGIFALALAITAPVFLFSGMQLRSLYVTDAINTNKFSDYLSLITVISLGSFALLIIYALFFVSDIDLRLTIIAITFAKMLENTSDLFQGFFQKKQRMDIVSTSLILKGLVSLICFFILLYLTGKIYLASFGIAFSWLLIFVFYDLRKALSSFYQSRKFNINVSMAITRFMQEFSWDNRLLLLALPLGGVIGLVSLNSNIPKYFISHYLGHEMLGVFAAVGYIVMVGRLIDISIGQAFAPRMAFYIRDKNRIGFLKLCLNYFSFGFIVSMFSIIIVYWFGDTILNILYTKEFGQYNRIFLILILSNGIIWSFSFLNHSMIIFRNTTEQFFITVLSTVILFIACLVLIPQVGLIGGAYAFFITNIISVPIKALYFRVNLRKI